jgi:predicted anti-sigma-YlaC factor YlaD
MGITCEEVWRDISDYVDDELDPKQRIALEEHFAECRHCAAVLEGTCNVIRLYCDERVLAPPKGFHDRLHERLDQRLNLGPKERIHTSRRAVLAWALTAAAAVPLGFALFSAKRIVLPRLEHQNPSGSPDSPAVTGLVAVSQDGDDKFYHAAGCPHLHGKPKFLPVKDAIREGYTPCVYCIGKARPKRNG